MVARGRDDGQWERGLVNGTRVSERRKPEETMELRGKTRAMREIGMEHVRMRVFSNEAETTAPRPAKAAADSMFAEKGRVSDDVTYCYWSTCSTCGC